MTQAKNDVIGQFAALQHLRDTEQQLGIEPLQRQEDCPLPSELMQYVLGEAAPDVAERIEKHQEDCPYCAGAIRSLNAVLAGGPLPEMTEETEDPVARWIESGESVKPKSPPPPVVSGDTSSRQETSIGYTNLFRDPAMWPVLLRRVRPWLPHLLRQANLAPELAADVLVMIQGQLPGLDRQQRFSPALLRWVTEFAASRGLEGQMRPLTEASIREAVEVYELEQALSRADPHEPPVLMRFREAARQQCHNLREFIAFAPADLAAEDYADYQEQLLVEAEERAGRELADVLG